MYYRYTLIQQIVHRKKLILQIKTFKFVISFRLYRTARTFGKPQITSRLFDFPVL